jgi:Na+/glutamate symporter
MRKKPAIDRTHVPPPVDPDLVKAICGLNADAGLAAAQRTRRFVMEANYTLQTRRRRRRRNMGVALLILSALILLLTPAIWSSIDDILGGEHFFDMPAMVMSLILLLFSTVFAALMIGWKNQQHLRHDKQ